MSTPQQIKENPEATVAILGHYVEASADSASRARTIMIVMITASVLTFVAYWNTRSDAWLTGRINSANTALWLFNPDTKASFTEDEAVRNVEETKKKFPNTKHLPNLQELKAARDFINARKIDDRDLLVDYIEHLRNLQLEQVTTLHAPFFGVSFDVNDLGIFSGFTFTVILLWFRFSLVRERDNLRQVFTSAKELGTDYHHHCYHLIAMRQVLTIPPIPHQSRKATQVAKNRSTNVLGHGLWRILPAILIFLPALVYLRLFVHDLQTIDLGITINWSGSLRILVTDLIFFFIIVGITLLCLRLSIEVDEEWTNQAQDLQVWEAERREEKDEQQKTAETAARRKPKPPDRK
ncbi:MAG TPA: hypothetical protein VGC89_17045 [Pyrinomonadaceae bacterium]|jgi:hypothetical protein